MGTVIIFALVAILAIFSSLSALKNKNVLGSIFGILSFRCIWLVFGHDTYQQRFSCLTMIM